MKVYLVFYDNGSNWSEDYEEWVEEVFSTKEKAEEFVKNYHKYGEYFNRIAEREVK